MSETPIITLPGSKSITNRALLLAALSTGRTRLTGVLWSQDTEAMLNALIALGISVGIDKDQHECVITGCGGHFPITEATICCGGSGITARFIMAVTAMQEGCYCFEGDVSLCQRPMGDLLDMLANSGVVVNPEARRQLPLTIKGKATLPAMITLSGNVSSQFVSGLLLSAPLAKHQIQCQVNNLVSKPYVNMTCQMMHAFGVRVDDLSQGEYVVAGGQNYVACKEYLIEPDASSASYFFAAAALLGRELCIARLDRENSLQGDLKFLAVLEAMGCSIVQTSTGICIQGPAALQGIEVDMGDISDTMMTLAAIAPFATTPTLITHIAHARHKESDRINAMEYNLTQMGIRVESGEDWLKIYPGQPCVTTVRSYSDHRIAMAFAVVALKVPGVKVDDPSCVAKTFPDFYELLARIG